MAALLAGARLVLRQGVRLLPVITRAAPVRSAHVCLSSARCLSSSSRFLSVLAQERGNAEAELTPSGRAKAYQDDWSIHQLGQRLKTKGRTTRKNLLKTFQEVCKTGVPTDSQVWFFLRACGSYMPEVPPGERTEMANNIWNKLKELGVEFNVSHYNVLLEVYLQNEHVFSPTEFLAKMEEANMEPDHGTFQGLIAAFCSQGDIGGASTILESMKNKNFPITEQVFNSLIKGHARAGDLESAKNVLSIMQAAGIEPQWGTHLALLNAYAENGEIEKIREILNDKEIKVPQKQLTSVIMALVKSGNSQYISDVLQHMPNCVLFTQDIINLSLALLTQGYEDAALDVCKMINSWKPANENSEMQAGDFFLRHCVNLNMPINVLNKCADELQAAEMHTQPRHSLLRYALMSANSDLVIKLMKTLKDEELFLKSRYFRPVFDRLLSSKDLPGLFRIFGEMKSNGVSVELDTLSKCVSLITSQADGGQAFLQEKDRLRDLKNVCMLAVLRELRLENLKRVESFLSAFPLPVLKDRVIGGVLGATYVQSRSVEALTKITGLLCKDGSGGRDSSASTEFISHFLYYVIVRTSGAEGPALVEHLRQYLHSLKEMGVTLDIKGYRPIQLLLENGEAAKLNEDVKRSLKSLVYSMVVEGETAAELENQLAGLEKDNLPIESVLTKLLSLLRETKDLPKALQLKSKYEGSFTFYMYMKLLSLCCEENDPVELLKLKKEIDQKGFSSIPTTVKYMMILKVLVENNLIEDAINILKEMQANDVPMDEASQTRLFHILNNLAIKGDAQTLNIIHEYGVMMGLVNPNVNMCGPLVTVHLKKNDLSAALNALVACTKKYKCSPFLHNVIGSLVETGETDLIKKLVDRLSDFMDDQWVLHELFFAFISTGKYSEAEKIAETPGMRAIQGKIDWFANRCIRMNQVEKLEKLVELSRKLFQCDRKDMYSQLLRLYAENNDLEKAKSTLYKMKEDNLVPSGKALAPLRSLFESNGEDLNAHFPEFASSLDLIGRTNKSVLGLCEEGKGAEAFAAYQEAKQNDVILKKRTYTVLIDTLVKDSLLKEADEVSADAKKSVSNPGTASNLLIEEQVRRDCLKDALVTLQTMLENGSRPGRSAVSRLITALALNGDVLGIEKIKELTERHEFSAKVLPGSMNTSIALAHLVNGNVEEGISMLENLYLNGSKDVRTMYLISHLLKKNMEEVVEKVSILIERLAHQFANYYPVTSLFVNYIEVERLEEARQLLQRCNAIAEQRQQLTTFIIRRLYKKKEEEATKIIEVLSDPYYKQVLYTFKMRGYAHRRDVDAALALYEQSKAEHMDSDELFLKVLAGLLRDAERPVPFSEPPESMQYYKEKMKTQWAQGKDDQEVD
ncbi:hypothetical protein GDO78_010025 [Eleutherodactylus coqui]|uniref:Pentatricopeptide repeat-containing protein-mitochondrial domain-containing protein n=2 Tax=Eleutherodactylus coqui TaxID=57060 RepID=A0A8J6FA91_ELECQ|nr:hypothetical protein GDO78_010025 [Eleutherodactylus coqui]